MASIANKTKYAAVLGIVLACAAFGAFADAPAEKSSPLAATVWGKEPTSFLGFELGKPIPSSFHSCGEDLTQARTPCLMGKDGILNLWHAPQLGFAYSNHIFLFHGSVREVRLTTEANNYVLLKNLLVERYGRPGSTSVNTVQNFTGATFSSEESVWDGHNVYIRLIQRHDKVDQSEVFVEDKALLHAAQGEYSAARSKAASKL